jgi:hypothetical protein
MTIRNLLVTASLVAALVIPTAASGQVLTAPVVGTPNADTQIAKLRFQLLQAKLSASKFQAQSRAAKNRAFHLQTKLDATKAQAVSLQSALYTAQSRAENAEAELDAYKHGQPWPPVPAPSDTCQGYMVDCTEQQLCDDWGMDCDLIAVQATVGSDESGSPEAN